jgi:hypothetical protein
LADFLVGIDRVYKLPLNPVIYNPGTGRSDHGSFWDFNYSAVLIIEAFHGGDFNPYYHSTSDRINKFNLTYFHNMVKLSVGALATLASEVQTVSVAEQNEKQYLLQLSNYPNPFNNSTMVRFTAPEDSFISLQLFNSIGERIEYIFSGYKNAGEYEIQFENEALSSGLYYLVMITRERTISHKIMLLK